MLKLQPRSWRTTLALVATLTANSAHAEIWAITDAAHDLKAVPPGVRLIKLDDQQRIERLLSRNLPTNPQQAAIAAQQRLNSPEGSRILRELADAQQGALDAWSVGVEKIPAVVVDRRYVVYGQPDVAAAIKAIEQARRQ